MEWKCKMGKEKRIMQRILPWYRFYRSAAKTLVCALVLLLAVSGSLRAKVVDRVVAMVNNDIILLSDLQPSLEAVAGTLDKQGYSPSEKKEILSEQRKRILDQLIYDKLTDQQVKRNNIKIGDEEVDATIDRIRTVNKMTDEDLRRALELEGLSYEKYREQIKERMLRTRLVNREVKSKIVVTEEDARAYYNSHQKEYGGQTKYRLRHILIKTPAPSGAAGNESSLKEIKNIYQRLKAGESFEKIAAQYSEAPSAERNGDLGVFDISILSDQIRQAVEGLEATQFSDVVDTDQGYQIFYVEEVIHSGGRPFEEVRAEIQEKLYADVVDRKFNEWIKDLRERSHIEIIDKGTDTLAATPSP